MVELNTMWGINSGVRHLCQTDRIDIKIEVWESHFTYFSLDTDLRIPITIPDLIYRIMYEVFSARRALNPSNKKPPLVQKRKK